MMHVLPHRHVWMSRSHHLTPCTHLLLPAQAIVSRLVQTVDIMVLATKKGFAAAGDLSDLLVEWGIFDRLITDRPKPLHMVVARCNEKDSDVLCALRNDVRTPQPIPRAVDDLSGAASMTPHRPSWEAHVRVALQSSDYHPRPVASVVLPCSPRASSRPSRKTGASTCRPSSRPRRRSSPASSRRTRSSRRRSSSRSRACSTAPR